MMSKGIYRFERLSISRYPEKQCIFIDIDIIEQISLLFNLGSFFLLIQSASFLLYTMGPPNHTQLFIFVYG